MVLTAGCLAAAIVHVVMYLSLDYGHFLVLPLLCIGVGGILTGGVARALWAWDPQERRAFFHATARDFTRKPFPLLCALIAASATMNLVAAETIEQITVLGHTIHVVELGTEFSGTFVAQLAAVSILVATIVRVVLHVCFVAVTVVGSMLTSYWFKLRHPAPRAPGRAVPLPAIGLRLLIRSASRRGPPQLQTI